MLNCNPNIREVCLDVKIPNVVQKKQGLSIKGVFAWLFCKMDENQLIELNASRIAHDIGLSRRQVYRAVQFLKRTNLLILKIARTGRGCHSLFYVNWKRSSEKSVPSHYKKNKNLNHLHDRPMPVQKTYREKTPWTKRMGAFRQLIDQTTFVQSEREHSLSLIGRCLQGKSTEWARELYHQLADRLYMLEPPNWVLEVRQFYAWFRSVINGMMKGVAT